MDPARRPTEGLPYLPGLDGLRALSIALVLASHGGATLALMLLLDAGWAARVEPLLDGGTGVQVFFVLSGFLITRLLRSEYRASGTVRLGRFYGRRMLRLAPPYAVMLVVVGGLVAAGGLDARYGRGLGLAAVYAYNFIPRDAYSTVLVSTWSLAIEEQFYLVLPVLLLAARRRPAAALATSAVALAAGHLWLTASPLTERFLLHRWPTAVFPTLFLGCLAALAWEHGLAPRRWAPWIGAALGAYTVSLWAPGLDASLAYHARSAGVAVGVVWTVAHPASRAVRGLEWAPLRYAGRLSYSLYLWQCLFVTTGPVVWAVDYAFGASYAANVARAAAAGPMEVLWLPPFNLLATVVAAVVSYHGVERPALRLRARLAGARQPSKSAPSRP